MKDIDAEIAHARMVNSTVRRDDYKKLISEVESEIVVRADKGYNYLSISIWSDLYPTFKDEMEHRGFKIMNSNCITNGLYDGVKVVW